MSYCPECAKADTRIAALEAENAGLKQDAARYRVLLANLESLVLRTDKGSTLTLTAARRGIEFARKGTDAVLDGLASLPAPEAQTKGAGS